MADQYTSCYALVGVTAFRNSYKNRTDTIWPKGMKNVQEVRGPYRGTRTRQKVSRPDWFSVIHEGLNATNNYFTETVEVFAEDGEVYCWNSDQKSLEYESYLLSSGCWMGIISAADKTNALNFTQSTFEAENKASTELYKNARAISQRWTGPTFIGEIRRTWNMMKKPGKALFMALKRFEFKASWIIRENLRRKRSNRLSTAELHSLLGSLWLEYKFGWEQLYRDTVALGEACAAIALKKTGVIRVQGSGSQESSVVTRTQGSGPFGFCNYVQTKTELVTTSVQYVGGLRIPQFSGHKYYESARQLGFAFDEFAPTLWELTPWSFLADYFANVGDLIEQYCRSRPNFVYLSKSIKLQKEICYQKSAITIPNGICPSGGGSFGSVSCVGTSFTRSDVVLHPPVIEKEIYIPDFDSSKWLNMIALLRFTPQPDLSRDFSRRKAKSRKVIYDLYHDPKKVPNFKKPKMFR